MTKVAIIGGKLQGLEAVYLGMKAGMETILIDCREDVPARGCCHQFIKADIINPNDQVLKELAQADFILPALENQAALNAIAGLGRDYGLRVAFDFAAYDVTSSKIKSDQLIHDHDIPAPRYYPAGKASYIAKPCFGSGSKDVRYLADETEVRSFLESVGSQHLWVIQEYLAGKSYSIEVIGRPGKYRTYQITELFMDPDYDCKRVTAPCVITEDFKEQFADIAIKLADLVKLNGIMDVEVIDDHGVPKVLEIDARMPSQTPTVVYHSSGVNLLEELWKTVTGKTNGYNQPCTAKHVSFEHLLIGEGAIRVLGEHIMSEAGPLRLLPGFCGAYEVLTDYQPGRKSFRGTFINVADTRQQLNEQRNSMLKEINKLMGEGLRYLDLSPASYE